MDKVEAERIAENIFIQYYDGQEMNGRVQAIDCFNCRELEAIADAILNLS